MKVINLNLNADVKDYGYQKVFKIYPDLIGCKEICLALLLLREELVEDYIELRLNNFNLLLKLNQKQNIVNKLDLKGKILKAEISLEGLEYILFFLLRYYRDRVGEAEHIDIDFKKDKDFECTLTIALTDYKEYSQEEIKKMLG